MIPEPFNYLHFIENAVNSKLRLVIVVVCKYLYGCREHFSELFRKDTCANTSM